MAKNTSQSVLGALQQYQLAKDKVGHLITVLRELRDCCDDIMTTAQSTQIRKQIESLELLRTQLYYKIILPNV